MRSLSSSMLRCLLFTGKGLSRTGSNLFQHNVVKRVILDAVLGTVSHTIVDCCQGLFHYILKLS